MLGRIGISDVDLCMVIHVAVQIINKELTYYFCKTIGVLNESLDSFYTNIYLVRIQT